MTHMAHICGARVVVYTLCVISYGSWVELWSFKMERSKVDTIQYNPLSDELASMPLTYTPSPASFRHSRLVKRSDGRSQINYKGLPPRGWYGFFKDGFTTIIDVHWCLVITLFCCVYCSSWLLFSFLWWGVDEAYESTRNYTCINEVYSFPSAFLYSLETQLTIGYGHRFISADCGFGVVLLIIQSLVGLLIDSFLLGLIFAKITRPTNRRKTILFSNHCVIYEKDGKRYLKFRIADIRKSQLVEAHVRVQLYWYKGNEETQDCTLEQFDLDVGYDTGKDRVILLTPVVASHLITEDSPLYSITEDNLLQQDLEIVVVLEAIVESTGLTLQALWSYTEREIMMDYCFNPMIYRNDYKDRMWVVDYAMLSSVIPCGSPK